MDTTYDNITAYHYAAYRPPLHQLILEKALGADLSKSLGLDIGCGVGHSAIALSHFCKKVIAIDPSKAMLEKALARDTIQYSWFNGQDLPFEKPEFDLITFAGSLFYAKSQRLLDEVTSVSKKGASILAYDFEILFQGIMEGLGLRIENKSEQIPYDHSTNFSGLHLSQINLIEQKQETIELKVAAANLAHLLLSEKDKYQVLSKHLGAAKPFDKLVATLMEKWKDKWIPIEAALYYSHYQKENSADQS